MKKDFVCQDDLDHKMWSALPIIVRVMYQGSCLFDQSAHLFVDLPARSAILSGIQATLSCTPQISFADSSHSQSVMPGCIRPRSIQGPDQGDRHGWGVDHRRPP
jgi:hypothetical protein